MALPEHGHAIQGGQQGEGDRLGKEKCYTRLLIFSCFVSAPPEFAILAHKGDKIALWKKVDLFFWGTRLRVFHMQDLSKGKSLFQTGYLSQSTLAITGLIKKSLI